LTEAVTKAIEQSNSSTTTTTTTTPTTAAGATTANAATTISMTNVVKSAIEKTFANRGDGGALIKGEEELEGLRVQLAHAHTTISRLSAALGVGRAAKLIDEHIDGTFLLLLYAFIVSLNQSF
jgi:hypothetical protein